MLCILPPSSSLCTLCTCICRSLHACPATSALLSIFKKHKETQRGLYLVKTDIKTSILTSSRGIWWTLKTANKIGIAILTNSLARESGHLGCQVPPEVRWKSPGISPFPPTPPQTHTLCLECPGKFSGHRLEKLKRKLPAIQSLLTWKPCRQTHSLVVYQLN